MSTNGWSWSQQKRTTEIPSLHDVDEPVYTTSVAAQKAGVHHQTLRAWERDGLLLPKRTAGRFRRYSDQDIERARLIRELLEDRGLNRSGARMVLELMEAVAVERARADKMERMARRISEHFGLCDTETENFVRAV